ncbi:MAG TPA: major capsid protein [Candidatus Limnocylindrales bacterium]|nr:major capsid protein [Candidatus Limnocylindrales bacterium]
MADIFSTTVINGVVASLIQPPSFLLDRFFPNVQLPQEGKEEIAFDTVQKTRRMAPFVSPLVEGKVVTSKGFKTDIFRPAYIKDKRVWDGNRALKRSAGEQIGGSLSPMQRMQAILAFELQDQVDMLTRRLEWMASQILQTGKVTIQGDNYPAVLVDFLRDASLTIALAGAAKWDQANVNPLDNLQTWALSVLKLIGANPIDVVMDTDAWVLFRNNQNVKDRLTLQRRLGDMPTMAQNAMFGMEGGQYQGTIDQFNIFTYAGYYLDDNGATQPMLPSGTVLMSGPQLEGYRAYGAIKDEQAGYQALPMFAKSWVEQDPAVRFLLMQSAPLLVPYRPNAMLCATVK